MPDLQEPQGIIPGKERTSMFESILLLAFCLLAGAISVAVVGYLWFIGQLLTLDGVLVALISLTIGGIFMLIAGWSVYSGELKQVLEQIRKKPATTEPSGASGETPK
jgi:purine-cytosine permease-like protein